MGLILDSSIAIAAERRGLPVEDLLSVIRELTGPNEVALSVVSVIELEHGIWRAKDPEQATRRKHFLEDLIANVSRLSCHHGTGAQSGPYRWRAASLDKQS
jgi:tRNA(fMet)-specific endonuclease VapC